jgi:hypothetical protein
MQKHLFDILVQYTLVGGRLSRRPELAVAGQRELKAPRLIAAHLLLGILAERWSKQASSGAGSPKY